MYDQIGVAEEYDATRYWEYDDPRHRAPLLAATLGLGAGTMLLDVGCGTGFYLAQLMEATGCRGVGIDRSVAMLDVARRRLPGSKLCQACAESLPIARMTVDAVLCHHAVHHFADVPQFLRESRRVLVDGGRIAMVTVSHEQMRVHPIYALFPEILAIDIGRIPDTHMIRTWMQQVGLADVTSHEVDRSSVTLSWEVVFKFVDRRFMSPMRLLPDSIFRAARATFADRVRRSEICVCPAESYTITTGIRGRAA